MKHIVIFAAALSVASGALVAAQLYRWVDSKGNVEYRDTPPPPDAKKVEERRITGTTAPAAAVPYSTQVAMKNFPVTLWAYDCGAPCSDARAHLARRGVPYTEKDPKPDLKAFEKLTGGNGVPVLFVGTTKLSGYLESEWDNALDAAGYPRTAAPGVKPAAKPPAQAADQKAAPAAKPSAPAGKDTAAGAPAQPPASQPAPSAAR
jgi:hypothetical protein